MWEGVPLHLRGFKIGLELIVRGNHGGRVVEVPYEWWDRKRGESKLGLTESFHYFLQLLDLVCYKYLPGGKVGRAGK